MHLREVVQEILKSKIIIKTIVLDFWLKETYPVKALLSASNITD